MTISINGRAIGQDHPPFIIAELSANHNGSLERALETIDAAQHCGADAIKLQTYTPDTITIDCDAPEFMIKGGLWNGYKLYDLYKWAQTPFEWHQAMFAHARKRGITVFSTPFDETAVDLLESLDAPAYKIASFELIDLSLIRYVARTGKPMIMSTGMATEQEIKEAVTAARDAGCRELVLLHCVSAYPASPDDMNLRTIPHLADAFGVVAGLSDHTLGTAVAVAAVTLGAAVVEKHMTLRRADGGPDAAFSLEPAEFGELVSSCRMAYAALGRVSYVSKESERGSLVFRRSLYAVADIAQGEALTVANVRSIRPGHGLAPKRLPELLGRRARKPIARGTALRWDLVE